MELLVSVMRYGADKLDKLSTNARWRKINLTEIKERGKGVSQHIKRAMV
jgi:hypothetical protein